MQDIGGWKKRLLLVSLHNVCRTETDNICNAMSTQQISLHCNIASRFGWLLLRNKMRFSTRRNCLDWRITQRYSGRRTHSFPESMNFFSSVKLYSIKGFVLNESLTMFFHLWIAVGTSGLTFQTPFVAPLTNSTWIPRLSGTFLFSQKKTSPVN